MTSTIAVFGATGRTGKHLVKFALEQGFKVRAMARTPSKVTTEHENLVVVEGDFANEAAIRDTVRGATYVISMAGGPENRSYPRLFINSFLKLLLPILEQEDSVEAFLSTSVMFATKPDGSLPWNVSICKPVCSLLGMGPAMEDHETNLHYLADNYSTKYKTIVMRPGRLEELTSTRTLRPSETPYFGQVAYQELAAYYLQAIQQADDLVDKFPFLVPE